MAETLYSLCNEFLATIKDVYAFYLDGFKGLEMMREDIERRQRELQCDDTALVPYLRQYDAPLELKSLLDSTIAAFKKRNRENGKNYELLGNMCLCAMYSWWEDHYRARFAAYLRKPKDGIKAPIFGDFRSLRHAIIHNNGVATKETENCEVLTWFKRGDRILLTFERFEMIIAEIEKFLREFYDESLLVR